MSSTRLRLRCASLLPLAAALLANAAWAQVPVVAGQVTAMQSASAFDVNGLHVVCDAATRHSSLRPQDNARVDWTAPPYLGEPLQIYGHTDRRTHVIRASRVVFAPADAPLSGNAVVQRILQPLSAGTVLLRADGYPILVDAHTALTANDAVRHLDQIAVNQWISYSGHQREDGVVVAEKATFRLNTVAPREQRLLAHPSYTTTAPAAERDSVDYLKDLIGAGEHHITPAQDDVLSARLARILARLVPQYQREMKDDDPAKIRFRCVLIDDRKLHVQVDLPDGTLLVPRPQVLRLTSDDEVAAYLAEGMAVILEKQQLRFALELRLLGAASWSNWIPAATWVGVGVLSPAAIVVMNKHDDLLQAETQQRVRVALALLHDAGYDLLQAPKAWWRLAAATPQTIDHIPVPDHVAYAYAVLGSTWRDPRWASDPVAATH